MPRYTVTDPVSKRTVTLTGESAPTEQELSDIFATLAGARGRASRGLHRQGAAANTRPVRGQRRRRGAPLDDAQRLRRRPALRRTPSARCDRAARRRDLSGQCRSGTQSGRRRLARGVSADRRGQGGRRLGDGRPRARHNPHHRHACRERRRADRIRRHRGRPRHGGGTARRASRARGREGGRARCGTRAHARQRRSDEPSARRGHESRQGTLCARRP